MLSPRRSAQAYYYGMYEDLLDMLPMTAECTVTVPSAAVPTAAVLAALHRIFGHPCIAYCHPHGVLPSKLWEAFCMWRQSSLDVCCSCNGKVLLLKRQSTHNNQTWALPGGNVEANDGSLLGTATREAHEELGSVPPFDVKAQILTK